MAGQRAVTTRSTPETDPFFYGWRYVTRQTPEGPVTEQVPLTEEDILHPQEGDFIVHNAAHDRDVRYLQAVIEDRIAGQSDKLLLCDHRVLWDSPELGAYGPDLILFEHVLQPWNPHRGTLPVWGIDAHPVLAIEVTSPSTRNTDLTKKVDHYYRAGIPLYIIVDHDDEDEEHPTIRLLAYEAGPNGYVALPQQPLGIWIEPLQLWLQAENDRVWCADEQGRRIPDLREQRDEERRRAEQAQQQAEQERRRAEQAQQQAEQERRRAEQAQQQAEQERRRAEQLRQQAEAARQQAEEQRRRAEQMQQQAEQERQARLALEERLRQLEQEMQRRRPPPPESGTHP